jgi:hypothetical protein
MFLDLPEKIRVFASERGEKAMMLSMLDGMLTKTK